MADVAVTLEGVEIARYSPMGLVLEGTLSMEPRAMRNIWLAYRGVVAARRERGLEVAPETDMLIECLHSLLSDAETHERKIEIRAVRAEKDQAAASALESSLAEWRSHFPGENKEK